MNAHYLSIASDFSATPGGRTPDEGDFSGEEFLADYLGPKFQAALDASSELVVDFDGTEGYATSFLEAAFGGLARKFGEELVLAKLKLQSLDEPYLVQEVQNYIREAKKL